MFLTLEDKLKESGGNSENLSKKGKSIFYEAFLRNNLEVVPWCLTPDEL